MCLIPRIKELRLIHNKPPSLCLKTSRKTLAQNPRPKSPFPPQKSLKTIPPPPIPGLPLQKRADGAQISLVAQEIRTFVPARPEFDGVGERVHGLTVAADEGAAEVYVLKRVLFGLKVGDLADVVAVRGWES